MNSNGEFEKVKETLADDAVSCVTEVVQVVSWGIQQSNGWHEKVFFETNLTNFLEGYFLKIQNNFHY